MRVSSKSKVGRLALAASWAPAPMTRLSRSEPSSVCRKKIHRSGRRRNARPDRVPSGGSESRSAHHRTPGVAPSYAADRRSRRDGVLRMRSVFSDGDTATIAVNRCIFNCGRLLQGRGPIFAGDGVPRDAAAAVESARRPRQAATQRARRVRPSVKCTPRIRVGFSRSPTRSSTATPASSVRWAIARPHQKRRFPRRI